MSRHGNYATATISSGASITGALNLDAISGVAEAGQAVSQKLGMRLGGIVMPAAWTAAGLTFQVSADGTSFFDLRDKNDNEVTMTVSAGKAYLLDLADWVTVPWIKIRSGASASAVNQGADRTLTLLLRATGV
ncbi:MAG: hypothetical protein WDO70_04180 [Alphaproteobacteria bacterium]